MGFLDILLSLFFPPMCVFCGKSLSRIEDTWCKKCTDTLPFTLDSGRQEGVNYDFSIAPFYYAGNVQKSIHKYKFRGSSEFANVYGKVLADCILENPDIEYDIISWVPLSGTRERSRGYDQAMLLALATALHLDDVAVETLHKPVDVRAQSEIKGLDARIANISGAYKVTDPELIEGKRILLIDDIITTGSTLSECAKVLQEAGANRIICAALARGQ
ncbi:MAG: ComF family protein [Oscillospiraceae bacterium]|nr:ComF family protein [Oscillospiraceae bacterium]